MLTRKLFKTSARILLTGTLLTTSVQYAASSEVLHHFSFNDAPGFLEDSVGDVTLSAQNFEQVALPDAGRGVNFSKNLPGIGENNWAANTPAVVASLTSSRSTPIDDAFTIELFANLDDLSRNGGRSVLVAQAENPYNKSLFGWAFTIEREGLQGNWNADPRELELFASDGDQISQFPSGILIDEQTDYYLSASFDIAGDIRFYVKDLSDGTVQTANVEHSMSKLRPDSNLQIGAPYEFAIMDGMIDEVRLSLGVVTIEELLINIEPVLGDVDNDGQLTAQDIDLIASAIRTPDNDIRFDVNNDRMVTAADHSFWVKDVKVKNTWFGDSNLDGEFNSGDFVEVFQAGKYETGLQAGWAQGDWTGDQRFDSGDFVAAFADGGFEVGQRAAVSAVPEPSCTILLGMGIAGLGLVRKRR